MLLPLVLLAVAPLPRMPRAATPSRLPPLRVGVALTIKTRAGETRTTLLPGQAPAVQRGTASIKAGEKPQIRWSVRNRDRKKPSGDLVVHFLIDREAQAGQPVPPGLTKGSLADTVLGTDLAAGEATTGSFNTPIHQPGTYRVQVELLDPDGNRRSFCALDLKVEP